MLVLDKKAQFSTVVTKMCLRITTSYETQTL